MSVTAFQDLPLADRDREWDGGAAEKRVREWAKATDEPNEDYRDAHVWYDAEKKDNYTAYKLLIADVVNGRLVAVPARRDGRGRSHAGLARRRRRAQGRHRPDQEPPGQVLPQDGRHSTLGGRLAAVPAARLGAGLRLRRSRRRTRCDPRTRRSHPSRRVSPRHAGHRRRPLRPCRRGDRPCAHLLCSVGQRYPEPDRPNRPGRRRNSPTSTFPHTSRGVGRVFVISMTDRPEERSIGGRQL